MNFFKENIKPEFLKNPTKRLLDAYEQDIDEISLSHIYYGLFEGYPGVFVEDLRKPGGLDLYKEMQAWFQKLSITLIFYYK